MPRKRQLSQPSSSNKKQKSQISIEESFIKSQRHNYNINEAINKCVRFVLYRAGNNLPIRRQELQKSVLHNVGSNFNSIIKSASETLKEVYGFNFYLSDEPSTNKSYLVANLLPYLQEDDEEPDASNEVPADAYKILIMLVLTHIFMSDSAVNESALFAFLRSIQIDPDEKHSIFGNVKEFVTVTMVKQKYLNKGVADNTKRVSYSWGSKAESEISKHELLKFVCKVYKDRTPTSWIKQLRQCEAQQVYNNGENPEASQMADVVE